MQKTANFNGLKNLILVSKKKEHGISRNAVPSIMLDDIQKKARMVAMGRTFNNMPNSKTQRDGKLPTIDDQVRLNTKSTERTQNRFNNPNFIYSSI